MKRLLKIMTLLFASAVSLTACGESAEPADSVSMRAQILSIGDKIEVDVLESEYTSGVHLVITGEQTVYLDEDGRKIGRSDLEVGDELEITYSGQVMLSYPPQIVALKIRII